VSPLEYSVGRLDAVLEEIGRLKESEFPYQHSRDALERVEQVFLDHRSRLNGLPAGKSIPIVNQFCSTALADLFLYLPLLGFILRSTNVRNAFEVYGPLLRLSRQALGVDTKLIVSSEWDYSLFTFREIAVLPKFVLIGFPAPESSNPLLLPLAGHELGHTIWRVRGCASNYVQSIEEKILGEIDLQLKEYQRLFPNHNAQKGQILTNIFVRQTISVPAQWALKQCEEHFCDFVGLYAFDEAFLHAFGYLLSPLMAGQRPVLYPNTLRRVSALAEAAAKYRGKVGSGYTVPADYSGLFQDMAEVPDNERVKKFLLSLADAASGAMTGKLMDEAGALLSGAKLAVLASEEKRRILDSYRFVVPAVGARSLCNILNAAWDVYHDKSFWVHMPQIDDRQRVLRELVLKNIEILEIEQILESPL
jgi:hypothetical protein